MHRLHRLRWFQWLSLLLVGTLLFEAIPLSAAPPAQAPPPQAPLALQDCSTVNEEAPQGELNTVPQAGAATRNSQYITANHVNDPTRALSLGMNWS